MYKFVSVRFDPLRPSPFGDDAGTSPSEASLVDKSDDSNFESAFRVFIVVFGGGRLGANHQSRCSTSSFAAAALLSEFTVRFLASNHATQVQRHITPQEIQYKHAYTLVGIQQKHPLLGDTS